MNKVEKPKISVIIPVYNTDIELFNRAIESIKFNCEIIIVNDGSDPEYNYICPGAKFINLKNNVGILHARRIGVEQATGDYILFLDSDDEFMDNAIELISKVIHSISSDSIDFIQFGMYESSSYTNLRDKLGDFISNKTGVISPYVTDKLWGYECLRTSIESFNDYPNVKLGEDYLIMINALFIARGCINVTDSIYIRHEPHTCNKLSCNASKDEVEKVWKDTEPLRDSIDRIKSEIKDIGEDKWTELKIRLSLCKLTNVDPKLIEEVTTLKVVKNRFIDSNLILKCNKLLIEYLKNCDSICSNCRYFDDDVYSCDYGQNIVVSCIDNNCDYIKIDSDTCDDKDPIISIPEYLNSLDKKSLAI